MTDLLDLLDAVADDTSPLGQDHYGLVIDAFREAARLDAGVVDPNRVRSLLAEKDGYAVESHVLSAAYARARATGRGRTPLIERHGWTTNTDTRGRNGGKPLWIAPELWFRMSWSARMRAVRRAMHVVPTPKTNTGAGAEPSGETAAAPVLLTIAAPRLAPGRVAPLPRESPRPTRQGQQATTPPAPVPPTWREAARRNHIALAYMVTVDGNHVTHPIPGVDLKHRRKSRAYRPVTP